MEALGAGISTHVPRKGDDKFAFPTNEDDIISTHVPRKGDDFR